jgi:hypothetical protein
MKHLNDGQLRAALDGEVHPAQRSHLDHCSICQERLKVMQSQVKLTGQRLDFLIEPKGGPEPSWQSAAYQFHQRFEQRKEIPMFQQLFSRLSVRLGTAIVVFVALIVSIPATRVFAGQLLSLFRVETVTVIPLDFSGVQQLSGNETLEKQVTNMISKSINETQKSGTPVDAADAAQASQMTGFNVRLPKDLTVARISVQNASGFIATVDRQKTQAILDEAGRKDLVLPESIDGAQITVDIPANARAYFGTCPEADTEQIQDREPRQYPDCTVLAEVPSPIVQAPDNLDISQLAQIALQFGGMSPQQAADYAKTVDWTSSLVIPIPKNASSYEQVQVDGVTGTLIQRPADDAPQYVLVWIKDGIIYAISSLGTDTQRALDMANSLQ